MKREVLSRDGDASDAMPYFTRFCLIFILFSLFVCTSVYSDNLPGEVPENQAWTTNSVLEAIGIIVESTSMDWHTSDAGFDILPLPVSKGNAIHSGSIAYASYKDSIMSNGGQISEVKTFSLDTHAKTDGLYNIATEKVLTYTSQNGSHLMGEEFYLLDVVGNWSMDFSDLVCVFSKSKSDVIPAFCNKVTASSKLRSITTAQIESTGSAAVIGTDSAAKSPAALQYEIAVVPDTHSASGYADGIVSTTFTVSVMEGRTDGEIKEVPDPSDPLGSRGTFTSTVPGTVIWTSSSPGSGVLMIWLDRDGVGLNEHIWLEYNGVMLPLLSGPFTGPVDFTSYGFPSGVQAQLSIDGNGGGTKPYIVTFEGVTYEFDPYLSSAGSPHVTLIPKPIGYHLKQYNELAARLTSIDMATVAGGISSFVKEFNYQSGINCANC